MRSRATVQALLRYLSTSDDSKKSKKKRELLHKSRIAPELMMKSPDVFHTWLARSECFFPPPHGNVSHVRWGLGHQLYTYVSTSAPLWLSPSMFIFISSSRRRIRFSPAGGRTSSCSPPANIAQAPRCSAPYLAALIPIPTWQSSTHVTTFCALAFLGCKSNDDPVTDFIDAGHLTCLKEQKTTDLSQLVNPEIWTLREPMWGRNVKWVICLFYRRYESWHVCDFLGFTWSFTIKCQMVF